MRNYYFMRLPFKPYGGTTFQTKNTRPLASAFTPAGAFASTHEAGVTAWCPPLRSGGRPPAFRVGRSAGDQPSQLLIVRGRLHSSFTVEGWLFQKCDSSLTGVFRTSNVSHTHPLPPLQLPQLSILLRILVPEAPPVPRPPGSSLCPRVLAV